MRPDSHVNWPIRSAAAARLTRCQNGGDFSIAPRETTRQQERPELLQEEIAAQVNVDNDRRPIDRRLNRDAASHERRELKDEIGATTRA
jgi:hypothetical protein